MAYYDNGSDTSSLNILPSGQAGAALAAGDLVYLDSSGYWQIAKAGTHAAEGIMTQAALQYEFVSPKKVAKLRGWSSQTIGAPAYLSTTGTTSNTVTATKPVGVQVQQIGVFDSATTLYVDVAAAAAESSEEGAISVFGSDGKFKASYATINLAVTALATEDMLVIKSGNYTLTGGADITKKDVVIVGEGKVIIQGAVGADYCFKILLGAQKGGVEFKNLTIVHDDDATQVGIQVNNTSSTGKVNVYVSDCEFECAGNVGEGTAGNSIDIDHASATDAVRVYVERSTIEGPVNMVTANDGDRLRFDKCVVRGGVVTDSGNYDLEMLFAHSIVRHGGISGGHSNQRCIYTFSVSETDADPNVYATIDADDNIGSATDQIIL